MLIDAKIAEVQAKDIPPEAIQAGIEFVIEEVYGDDG